MEFEFDEAKRALVLRQKGVDLVYAARIFDGFVLTPADERNDYGEVRMVSLGMVGDECFNVVHTERNGRRRLITAWKGGRHDQRSYQAGLAGRDPADAGEG